MSFLIYMKIMEKVKFLSRWPRAGFLPLRMICLGFMFFVLGEIAKSAELTFISKEIICSILGLVFGLVDAIFCKPLNALADLFASFSVFARTFYIFISPLLLVWALIGIVKLVTMLAGPQSHLSIVMSQLIVVMLYAISVPVSFRLF